MLCYYLGLIPHLRARPFWDSSEFDWVKEVEGKYADIKKELLSLQGFGGFQPYRGPSWSATALSPDGIGGLAHDAGHWNVYYLLLHNLVSLVTILVKTTINYLLTALLPMSTIEIHIAALRRELWEVSRYDVCA